jgi:acyl-CoA reductase-like NAD-dependent aldehyde dehydrogenase
MQQILMGGAWVHAGEGPTLDIVNPATLERLGAVPECGPGVVAQAVAAARAALPAWQAVPASQKGVMLQEVGDRIRSRRREIAILLTQESGKPLGESIDCLHAVVNLFEAGGAMAARGSASPQLPVGVVAAITPFNFPLLLMASAIASALAAGNSIVCKPAHQNPLANLKLAEVFDVLPDGVVNVITGGPEAALALARHPDVSMVKFTGSAAVGSRIVAAARGRADLEPGCVGALIVCRDADLEITVPAIAWARLCNAGQVCTSGKHIYVERPMAQEFVERMHQCVGFLDVDDPLKRSTDLGPLISLEAAHRVEDQVGRALREGAKLILGGRRFQPSGLPGHFFQPTILAGVHPGSVPTREEILGPVITITPVADVAEAMRLGASGAKCGISIYTRDPQAVLGMLESIGAGDVRINDPAIGAAGPFSGMRHREMQRLLGGAQRTHVAGSVERRPWWFPYQARAPA